MREYPERALETTLQHGLRGDVDGIADAAIRRDERADRSLVGWIRWRELETAHRAGVGEPRPGATRGGQHGHVVAGGQTANAEVRGQVEHLVDIVHAQDAELSERRRISRIRADQAGRVRGGGAAARVSSTHLGQDDWLAQTRRLVRHGNQAFRLPKRLDEAQDDPGARLIEQGVDVVAPAQVDFVAGADYAAHGQATVFSVIEQ